MMLRFKHPNVICPKELLAYAMTGLSSTRFFDLSTHEAAAGSNPSYYVEVVSTLAVIRFTQSTKVETSRIPCQLPGPHLSSWIVSMK